MFSLARESDLFLISATPALISFHPVGNKAEMEQLLRQVQWKRLSTLHSFLRSSFPGLYWRASWLQRGGRPFQSAPRSWKECLMASCRAEMEPLRSACPKPQADKSEDLGQEIKVADSLRKELNWKALQVVPEGSHWKELLEYSVNLMG